jgi:hypothetical protein
MLRIYKIQGTVQFYFIFKDHPVTLQINEAQYRTTLR